MESTDRLLCNPEERERIKKKAVTLVRLIQDEISVNPRSVGKAFVMCKVGSDIFLEKLKQIFPSMDEITWVKILKFLRETKKFKYFYETLLRVPFEHDGGSCMHFPEVYAGENKMLVRVLVDINTPSFFYPNVPGIDQRTWKKGELVYVPADKASRFLKINWIEPVN